MNLLSDKYMTTLMLSLCLPFTLLKVSFDEKKFLISLRPNYQFFLWLVCFVLRNLCPPQRHENILCYLSEILFFKLSP